MSFFLGVTIARLLQQAKCRPSRNHPTLDGLTLAGASTFY